MAGPDLSVFERVKTIRDFDRDAEQRDIQRLLAAAEIRKASMLDVDAMGEQAFFKAAQGLELTPQEQAAAAFVDAKSGGTSFNPVTGEIMQRPRISDKIGIGMSAPAAPSAPMPMGGQNPYAQRRPEDEMNLPPPGQFAQPGEFAQFAPINEADLYATSPRAPAPMPAMGMPQLPNERYMTPKERMELSKSNIDASQTRIKEMVDSASNAQKASSTLSRMEALLPRVGYTGMGAGAVGAVDKALTGVGLPNVIKGDVAAREALNKLSIDQWVASVSDLKGALSNVEGERFDRGVASIGMTKEGIQTLARMEKLLAQRANERSVFYQDWFARTGGLNGADAAWEQYASANPVITEQTFATASERQAPAAQSAPKQNPTQRQMSKPEIEATLFNARKAVKAGRNPDVIRQRLIDAGIDPAGAGL